MGTGCYRIVAYKLDLPLELSALHDIFHVSTLKKSLSMETVEVQINEQLRITGEPTEILDQEVKQLRHSKIPIVKGTSRRGEIGVTCAVACPNAKLLKMANTVTNTNNLSLRSILEKDKLTGANFLNWERILMILLRHKRKWYVL
ncbi:hypothetical protein OSB04_023852 [Centaurea solstitialis]|uniref:Tf2-1-like SH3-like domain-containing protein n=1 Tax=Centaurea solstitialis TaxID=347529 RepID=A0AA38W9T7_9ASTR|nr:hypothetical protein OSB04_023852 [Centaurea solstitialis]